MEEPRNNHRAVVVGPKRWELSDLGVTVVLVRGSCLILLFRGTVEALTVSLYFKFTLIYMYGLTYYLRIDVFFAWTSFLIIGPYSISLRTGSVMYYSLCRSVCLKWRRGGDVFLLLKFFFFLD